MRDKVFGMLSLCQHYCREAVLANYFLNAAIICTKLATHHFSKHYELKFGSTISLSKQPLQALELEIHPRKQPDEQISHPSWGTIDLLSTVARAHDGRSYNQGLLPNMPGKPIPTKLNIRLNAMNNGRIIWLLASNEESLEFRRSPKLFPDCFSKVLSTRASNINSVLIESLVLADKNTLYFNPRSTVPFTWYRQFQPKPEQSEHTSKPHNATTPVPQKIIKNKSRYSLISKSLPISALGILTPWDLPLSRHLVEGVKWWLEFFHKAKPILKQENLDFFLTSTGMVSSMTSGCKIGDRVCQLEREGRYLEREGRRLAILSANGEVIGKGLQIVPLRDGGETLPDMAKLARRAEYLETVIESENSEIELRVDVHILLYLCGYF